MTAPHPADTAIEPTEFARQIMKDVYGYRFCASFSTFQDGESEPNDWCLTHDQSRRWCRQYQDEILTPLLALIEARDAKLADPAERDEPYDQLDNQRNLWAKQCHEAESRAERAEAKLAQTEMALSDAMSAEVAELRATVDRVRGLADEWDRTLQDTLRVEIDELRAALDGEGGEQHE